MRAFLLLAPSPLRKFLLWTSQELFRSVVTLSASYTLVVLVYSVVICRFKVILGHTAARTRQASLQTWSCPKKLRRPCASLGSIQEEPSPPPLLTISLCRCIILIILVISAIIEQLQRNRAPDSHLSHPPKPSPISTNNCEFRFRLIDSQGNSRLPAKASFDKRCLLDSMILDHNDDKVVLVVLVLVMFPDYVNIDDVG